MNNPAKELMNVMRSHPDSRDGVVETDDVPAVLAERAYEYLRSYGDDLRTFEKDAFGYYCDSTDNVISIVPSKEGYKVRYSDNSEPVSKDRYSKSDSSDQYAMEGGIGEWWLQDGSSEYADGDVNHEMIASNHLRMDIADSIGHEYDDSDDLHGSLNLSEDSEHRAQAVESGFDHDEIDAAAQIGNADPRLHAAKRYGWTRLAENEMQTYGLNRGKLQSIANDLGDILAQHTDDEDVILKSVWNIEDASNGNYHKNVPFHVLESGDMKSLRGYRYSKTSSEKYQEDEFDDLFDTFDSPELEGSEPASPMPTGEQTEDRKELRDEFDPKLDQVKSDATLHPEKEEFFSESKVRDNDGKLLVLYHGTPSGKLVQHDRRLSGDPDFASHGQGYYHTDNLSAAMDYAVKGRNESEVNPAVLAVHLNIKNPFDTSKDSVDHEDFINWYKKRTGDSKSAENMLKKIDELSSVSGKVPNDYEGLRGLGGISQKYLSRYLRSKGFDGIKAQGRHQPSGERPVDHTIWLAFHPNQIKSVSNTTPSGDPRMDYSL